MREERRKKCSFESQISQFTFIVEKDAKERNLSEEKNRRWKCLMRGGKKNAEEKMFRRWHFEIIFSECTKKKENYRRKKKIFSWARFQVKKRDCWCFEASRVENLILDRTAAHKWMEPSQKKTNELMIRKPVVAWDDVLFALRDLKHRRDINRKVQWKKTFHDSWVESLQELVKWVKELLLRWRHCSD